MKDNKPFAMFFNASPRKGWNTHKMLEAAKAAAADALSTKRLRVMYFSFMVGIIPYSRNPM